ncbi:MAG: hypothetical protein ACM31D_11895 [Bacteroidota bacterium]
MNILRLAAVLAVLAVPAWAMATGAGGDLPDPPPTDWQGQAQLFGRVAPSTDDDGIIAWERQHQAVLSSGYLFDLSRRLLARDPDQAMEFYVVAMVRGRYDSGRCVDDTAGRAVSRLSGMAAEVLRYGESHRGEFAIAGQRALARPDLLSHTIHPDWVCVQALSGMGGRSAGTTPPANWPALEQKLRREWGRQFEAMAAR